MATKRARTRTGARKAGRPAEPASNANAVAGESDAAPPAVQEPFLALDGAHFATGQLLRLRDGSRSLSPTGGMSIDDVGGDDVLEIEWDDGVTEFVRRSDVGLGDAVLRGAGSSRERSRSRIGIVRHDDGSCTVTRLNDRVARGAFRDGLRWIARRVVVLVGGVTKTLAVAGLGAAFDAFRVPTQGLVRVSSDLSELPLDPSREALADRDYVLLIHGTASNTATAFAALRGTGFLARATKRAEETAPTVRVLAFNHHTLSVSPEDNALELVKGLPDGARLTVVSHSRGGLVADLLAVACAASGAEEAGRRLVARLAQVPTSLRSTAEKLLAIRDAAQTKRLRVRATFRVASPSLGTTLLADHGDKWLGLLWNVQRIDGLAGEGLGRLKAIVGAVVRRRDDMEQLPGLATMMPGAPLLSLLNGLGPVCTDRLVVIAGEVEPRGSALRRLGVLAADLFFGEPHDFVVPSDSMRGGAERENVTVLEAHDCGHSSYFTRLDVQTYLLTPDGAEDDDRALMQAPGGNSARGGEPGGHPPVEPSRFLGMREKEDAIVFVIPGILGSELKREDGQVVWVSVLSLCRGVQPLAIATELLPTRPLWTHYGLLTAALRRQYTDVRPFPYDWRRSIVEAGAAFAERLAEALGPAGTTRVVHIVAHSMGGLVLREAFRGAPELLERYAGGSGRVVMAGTPNHGSWSPVQVLRGEHPVLTALDSIGSETAAQSAGHAAAMPGLIQMLPFGDAGHETHADYRALARPPEQVASDARWWQREIQTAAETFVSAMRQRVILLAGVGETPAGIDDQGRAIYADELEGDGTVLHSSLRLGDIPIYVVEAGHSQLVNAPRSVDAIVRSLTGTAPEGLEPLAFDSRRLRPAAAIHGAGPPRDLSTTQPRGFTGQPTAILATALDGRSTRRRAPRPNAIELRVVHGEIRAAEGCVVVGHGAGTSIRGIEGVLDACVGGSMRRHFDAGLYPERVGDVRSFRVPTELRYAADTFADAGASARRVAAGSNDRPLAAIAFRGVAVAGLGDLGSLGRADLRRAICLAACDAALAGLVASPVGTSAAAGRLSVVLVARRSALQISVASCVEAILLGVLDANRRIEAATGVAAITTLDIVEYLSPVAREAAEAAVKLLRANRERFLYAFDERVTTLAGGLERNQGLDPADVWSTLRITRAHAGDSRFSYELQGRTSHASRVMGLTPAEVLESLTLNLGGRAPTVAAHRLLFPPEIEAALEAGADLRLVVDRDAARIPWEFASRQGEPLAVSGGLVRQFSSPAARRVSLPVRKGWALVIADTDGTLPNARAEGRAVASSLAAAGFEARADDDVKTVEQQQVSAELSELFSDAIARDESPQVLHVAAHGTIGADEDTTGIVLGPRLVLTGWLVKQLACVPELVFLNCCESGHLRPTPAGGDGTRQAAWRAYTTSLADALLEAGSRAVILTGWEVSDDVAAAFAERFYARMLGGASFGAAVRSARTAARDLQPDDTTWAAYQAWGDPEYRLSGGGDSERTPIVSTNDALALLRDIQKRAALPWRGSAERARLDLDAFVRAEGAGFGREILMTLAWAYDALGDYKEAERAMRRYVFPEAAETDRAKPEEQLSWATVASKYVASPSFDSGDAQGLGERLLRCADGLFKAYPNGRVAPHEFGATLWRVAVYLLRDGDPSRHKYLERAERVYRDLVANAEKVKGYEATGLAALVWARGGESDEPLKRKGLTLSGALTNAADNDEPGSYFWTRVTRPNVELLTALFDVARGASSPAGSTSSDRLVHASREVARIADEFATPGECASYVAFLVFLYWGAGRRAAPEARGLLRDLVLLLDPATGAQRLDRVTEPKPL